MDVSRISTDFVTISTLPKGQNLLQVSIYSEANQYNNQLNVYEKQLFKAVILNNMSNIIPDMSKYTFSWSVSDSSAMLYPAFLSSFIPETKSMSVFFAKELNDESSACP
jgi:hypothetical protein